MRAIAVLGRFDRRLNEMSIANRRFSIMQAMIEMSLAAVIPATLGRIYRHRQPGRGNRKKASDALGNCRRLLDLIRHLQQHRGLCSAWRAGDGSIQARLAAKSADVSAALMQLSAVAESEMDHDAPCFTSQDLSLFQTRWRRLCKTMDDLSVEQSIAQHNQLIARVLGWLSSYGDSRIELPADGAFPAGAVRNFCHNLPALTEVLGQARAMGMVVAAHGGCPAATRVRLMFLTSRGDSLLQQTLLVKEEMPGAKEADAAVREFLKRIRSEMLSNTGVAIGTAAYFELATLAIDRVFVWIDECITGLEPAHRPVSSSMWQLFRQFFCERGR